MQFTLLYNYFYFKVKDSYFVWLVLNPELCGIELCASFYENMLFHQSTVW